MRQTKARALGGDLRQRVQEVARRARQAVEARDGERVALAKLRENAGKLAAVGLRSAGRRAGHNHRSEGPSRHSARTGYCAPCRFFRRRSRFHKSACSPQLKE